MSDDKITAFRAHIFRCQLIKRAGFGQAWTYALDPQSCALIRHGAEQNALDRFHFISVTRFGGEADIVSAALRHDITKGAPPFLCYITLLKKEEKIMKTKKVVVGAIAATMLSLSVCSLAPVTAAGGTVQISVGKTTAEVGGTFSVDVSLADLPSSGVQAIDFAVTYDSSAIKIDSVDAGALLKGSDSADPTASLAPLFEGYDNKDKSYISLIWSTSSDDPSYWINGDGVFCTISGTVLSGAKDNTTYDLKITPINRENFDNSPDTNDVIGCGYESDGKPVRLEVSTADGSVSVGKEETTTTASGKVTLRGDANCDDGVDMGDIVLIMQSLANPNKYGLNGSEPTHITAQGELNCDVDDSSKGITVNDALKIQLWLLKSISEL